MFRDRAWLQTGEPDRPSRRHVIPLDDAGAHMFSAACPCKPRLEQFPNGGSVVSHTAWDWREFAEAGESYSNRFTS